MMNQKNVQPTIRWRYLLQEAALILGFSYLFLLDSNNSNLAVYPLLIASAVVITLFAVGWFIAGQAAPTPLRWPGLIWIGAYGLAIFTSIDPRRSITELGMMLVVFFCFALVADLLAHGWPGELIVKSILIAGAIAVAFSWLGVIQWYQTWLAASPGEWIPSITYRLSAPNTQTWNLNPILILAAARFLYARKASDRIVLGLLILSSAGLIFLGSSRGGWIGMAAGLAFLGFLYIRGRSIPWRRTLEFIKQRKFVAGIAGAVGLILLSGVGYVLYRQTLHPTHGNLLDSRTDYWGPAIQTFLAYPITGQGPYTFISSLVRAHSTPPFGIYLHAHSIPLTVLAETGVIGFLAFAALVVFAGWLLIRRIRKVVNGEQAIVFGAVAALIAAAVHGLFDCFVGHSMGTYILAAAAGIVFAAPALSGGRKMRPWGVLLIITVVWLFVWNGRSWDQAFQLANNGEDRASSQLINQITAADPSLASGFQQLGLLQSEMIPTDPGSLASAIQSFERAVQLDPTWPLNHANLAALYETEGKFEQAQIEYQKAVDLAPDCGIYVFHQAMLLEKIGNLEDAQKAYLHSLDLIPAIQPAVFWTQNDFRRKIQADWVAQNPVAHQSEAELEEMVATHPIYDYPYFRLAAFKMAENKFEEARRLLAIADLAFPSDANNSLELQWQWAEWYAHQGDLAQAVSRAENILVKIRSSGIAGPGTDQGQLYTRMAFRQPVLSWELVPQLSWLPLSEGWAPRMKTAAGWYRSLGDSSSALKMETLTAELVGSGK